MNLNNLGQVCMVSLMLSKLHAFLALQATTVVQVRPAVMRQLLAQCLTQR